AHWQDTDDLGLSTGLRCAGSGGPAAGLAWRDDARRLWLRRVAGGAGGRPCGVALRGARSFAARAGEPAAACRASTGVHASRSAHAAQPRTFRGPTDSADDLVALIVGEATTPMGARELRRWLDQPLRNRDRLEERLSRVDVLVNDPLVRG